MNKKNLLLFFVYLYISYVIWTIFKIAVNNPVNFLTIVSCTATKYLLITMIQNFMNYKFTTI